MARDSSIIQGAVTDEVIQPTWGTLDGSSASGGITMEQIRTDIQALLDENYYTKDEIDEELAGKQALLTFDNVPVSGSDNPVKSGGLYTALAGKSNTGHTHSGADINSGVVSGSYGGTGESSLTAAGSALINALAVGASAAQRDDYIVAQYAGGGTTTTTYHRRKVSNLFKALNASDITTALGFTPVNKAGDTISGTLFTSAKYAFSYRGTNANTSMIRFLDNAVDTTGNGISIGGGGITIIGGGEAAANVESVISSAGSEQLILCNDGGIDIWTNYQSGDGSAVKRTIDTSGNFSGKAFGIITENTAGYETDVYGNFTHRSSSSNNTWNIKNNAGTSKFSVDFESGEVTTKKRILSNPGSGVNYISGCAGNGAGIYVKKDSLNSSHYIPGITIQTNGGGGWAIGNYNNENLVFSYGTKANIDASNNSVLNRYIDTDGNYSGNASNVTGTVAVDHGGTGATTAANARSNLGITAIAVRPDYQISTSDLTDGSSNLANGKLYFVY